MGLLNDARFVVGEEECAHLPQLNDVEIGEHACRQCQEMGDRWFHLRICMVCGEVGCCDTSKNKHASKHAAEVNHPIARSIEPGESWMWCFEDELVVAE